MKSKQLPKWKDGQIDPDWLANAGLRFVRPWMRSRLEGNDPYLPIDHRVDEDPEAAIVALLREVGSKHEAFRTIGQSVLALLDEAAKNAKAIPPYFDRLIRLCQLISLPDVNAWFDEQVRLIATNSTTWPERDVREILYAASVQRAGATTDWEKLLAVTKFSTLALLALGASFPSTVKHLAAWRTVVDRDEFVRELEEIIRSALRSAGVEHVHHTLLSARHVLTTEIQDAIDSALRNCGVPQVYASQAPIARTSPLVNAAWRRDLVLKAS